MDFCIARTGSGDTHPKSWQNRETGLASKLSRSKQSKWSHLFEAKIEEESESKEKTATAKQRDRAKDHDLFLTIQTQASKIGIVSHIGSCGRCPKQRGVPSSHYHNGKL